MEKFNLAIIENNGFKKVIFLDDTYLGLSSNEALEVVKKVAFHNNNERIKEEDIFKNAISIYPKKKF